MFSIIRTESILCKLTLQQPRAELKESDYYTPPVRISNRAITQKFIKVAQEFSFLDQVFAECFRAFEEAVNHDVVRERLVEIRNDLVRRQHQSPDPNNSQAGYIGCLGEFCEDFLASWEEPASNRRTHGYKSGLKYGNECVIYLQDTLEIPYWKLVIDLFLNWRESNKSSMVGTAILHMLRNKTLLCRTKVEELAQLALLDTTDRDGITTVVRSIQKRLDLLNDALEVVMPDEGLEVTASVKPGIQRVHSELLVESGPATAHPLTTHVSNYPPTDFMASKLFFVH